MGSVLNKKKCRGRRERFWSWLYERAGGSGQHVIEQKSGSGSYKENCK